VWDAGKGGVRDDGGRGALRLEDGDGRCGGWSINRGGDAAASAPALDLRRRGGTGCDAVRTELGGGGVDGAS